MSPERTRQGVVVMYPFRHYKEGQFIEDPALIDQLIDEGESWRFTEAVFLREPNVA